MPSRAPIRSELSRLGRLALPLAIANAGQALMGLVDTAVCGRAGAVVLAGAGLGNAITMATWIFAMGLMMGLDPLVSQAFGASDLRRARHLLWQGTWLAIVMGILLAVPVALVPFALRPVGIEDAVAREASGFVWLRLPSLPAFLVLIAAKAYVQGLGLTRAIVISTVIGNVVNLAGDLLFVFGGAALPAWSGPLRTVPAMGAAGAGLSTAFVTIVQMLVVTFAVRSIPTPGGISGLRRPRRAEIVSAVRVGTPIALHMGAEVGVFALVGLLAGRLGREPLAAHQIAIALASFSFCFALGIGQAGSVRVGWAVGAGDTPAARRSGLAAFAAGASVMAIAGLLFLSFPTALARLMSDDAAVVATTAPLLVVAAVFQVFDGVQAVGAGVLRGAGDTRFTFVANVVGHWAIGFPVAITLGLVRAQGVTGLWWGLCVGLSAVGITLLVRFIRLSARPIVPLASTAPQG